MRSTAAFSAPHPAAQLAAFNRQVEEHQALIYTVAFRLLGEASAATAATSAAVRQAYERPCPADWGARAWLLRWLLRACATHTARPASGDALGALPVELRQAVALVDLAGLDYAQAARVLDVDAAQVRARLAQARRALMMGSRRQ